MGETRYASFDPEGFAQGGGLLDDADVTLKDVSFQHYDFGGTGNKTCLRVVMEDQEGKLHEQYYSVGDPEKFAPSDDGSKVLLTGTATGIHANSNFAKFASSLINAGVPRSVLQTDDIRGIAGMKLHVNAVANRDKDGNVVKNKKGYDSTTLLASKLIALPGEAPKAGAKTGGKKAAGAPATSAPAAAAAPAAVNEETADSAVRYIVEATTAQGGSVARSKISALVFQAAMKAKDANKAAVSKLAFDPTFLTENSGRPVESGDTVVAFEYDAEAQTISAAA